MLSLCFAGSRKPEAVEPSPALMLPEMEVLAISLAKSLESDETQPQLMVRMQTLKLEKPGHDDLPGEVMSRPALLLANTLQLLKHVLLPAALTMSHLMAMGWATMLPWPVRQIEPLVLAASMIPQEVEKWGTLSTVTLKPVLATSWCVKVL